VSCPRCGAELGGDDTSCPSCGATVVGAEQIDSLLATRVEPPLDEVEPEELEGFAPLAVSAEIISEQFLTDGASAGRLVGPDDDDRPAEADAAGTPGALAPVLPPSSETSGAATVPVGGRADPPEAVAPAPEGAEPTDAAETGPVGPLWGSREHPPPVLAPPPPEPLEAPAVTRTRAPSGTGLPPRLSGAVDSAGVGPALASGPHPPPAPLPSGGPPAAPPAPSLPESGADRSTGRRGRRWFGRGGREPEPAPAVGTPAAGDHRPVAPVAEAFPGSPEGLLDGVAPEPDLGAEGRDPGSLESAVSRTSAGSRRAAQAALLVVAAVMQEGEVAEAAVQGSYQHRNAVAVLTDRRVVVANDRPWAPDVRSLPLDAGLVVHGWQDDRHAALVFVVDGVGVHLAAITDRPLARDLAQRVRTRTSGADRGAAG
jgi:hypothetical protein